MGREKQMMEKARRRGMSLEVSSTSRACRRRGIGTSVLILALGIEKIGIERLKEALEACEWEGADIDTVSEDLGLDDGFGAEAAEVERELMGLKRTVNGGEGFDEGEDEGVEELESMMLKMQTIKDMGADMPEAERRKFAAKAVRDVMKTH